MPDRILSYKLIIVFYLRVFALTCMEALMSQAHGAQELPFAEKLFFCMETVGRFCSVMQLQKHQIIPMNQLCLINIPQNTFKFLTGFAFNFLALISTIINQAAGNF